MKSEAGQFIGGIFLTKKWPMSRSFLHTCTALFNRCFNWRTEIATESLMLCWTAVNGTAETFQATPLNRNFKAGTTLLYPCFKSRLWLLFYAIVRKKSLKASDVTFPDKLDMLGQLSIISCHSSSWTNQRSDRAWIGRNRPWAPHTFFPLSRLTQSISKYACHPDPGSSGQLHQAKSTY